MTVAELESRVENLEAQVASLRQELERTRIAARIRRGLDQADHGQVLPARGTREAFDRAMAKVPARLPLPGDEMSALKP